MSRADSALFVATGGGGDALACLMLARALGTEVAGIATLAWERKMFDPRPGPRRPDEFAGLRRVGQHNWQIASSTKLRGGHSFLPQLGAESDAPLFLLDASRGTNGVREQMGELVALTRGRKAILVDVGGDILASGNEAGLRSPLADALVLSAADVFPDVQVVCLGLGLDGELSQSEVQGVLDLAGRKGWTASARLPAAVAADFRPYFRWHPSEATGLACLAALGYQGHVEVRAEGLTVRLDKTAALMHRFDYQPVLARNRIAGAIAKASSLPEVETIVRRFCGYTEIDVERRVLSRWAGLEADGPQRADFEQLERALLEYSDRAEQRGIRYLTLRRMAEVLDLSGRTFTPFRRFLAARHQQGLEAPVWLCRKADRSRFTLAAAASRLGRARHRLRPGATQAPEAFLLR